MVDFKQSHPKSRLIGEASFNFNIGYEKDASLIELIRTMPYNVILFDEIEHAHDNVLGILFRLFSEGTIADSDGIIADARNSIIIMTSNIIHDKARQQKIGLIVKQ